MTDTKVAETNITESDAMDALRREAPSVTDYDRDFLLHLLDQMLVIRRVEEKAGQMYGLQKIGGFCHLYIGQEAVAVGSIAALDMSRDYILTGYRDHGHALAVGTEAGPMMAELYGRATGVSKGKGGSMHIFDVERNMLGGNGIVGGHIPVATGVAYAVKYREEDGVVLCYFGDGAIHQGAFHESLNLARIWDLPIVYIIENNQYGMGTDYRRVSAIHDLYRSAEAYGMEGTLVDGMDVLAVYETTKRAVAEAKGGQPSLIEMRTYRYRGHSMSDPGRYRTREELETYRQQDPLLLLSGHMQDAGLLTKEEYAEMDKRAKQIAQDSVDFSENSPEPELDELYTDIYA